MRPNDDRPIDTIRLSPRDRRKVVQEINRQRSAEHHGRRDLRVEYNIDEAIVQVDQPNGNRVRLAVLPRNLSRRGMAYLVGRFIYPRSSCLIHLNTLDGERCSVEGTVLRCEHVGGILHEVAVLFRTPVDISLFIELTPEQRELWEAEQREHAPKITAPAARPRPQALIVDDNKTDARLLAMWLKKLGYEATCATNIDEAIRAFRLGQHELVLVDQMLGREDGLEVVRHLRDDGFRGPIVAISADDSPQRRAETKQRGCSIFLAKPLDQATLEDTLSEVASLPAAASAPIGQPIRSVLVDDAQVKTLLPEFVEELRNDADRLRRAMTSADTAIVRQLCMSMKGSGGSFGYEQVSRAAGQVLDMLASAPDDLQAVTRRVQELSSILRRVVPD